ncbi:MAG: phosphoenolpyruvate--protein phosphotransferase [Pseudomonadales bacterium]|nr:phosphoenolpyruvate--protein phosphotransferase [Pseudomonadales bacterium]
MTPAGRRGEIGLSELHRIVVDASAAHTVEAQIDRLVSGVHQAMRVDVCSLYQVYAGTSLKMVANRGLSAGVAGRIELPLGEGLVGKIAFERMPLSLAKASRHPAYRYFPESGEEGFEAFLGVPIVQLGQVIGVIVVQNRDERAFSEDEQTFLITVAAQLAPNLLRMPALSDPRSNRADRRMQGIRGAPGKSLGTLHLVVGEQTLQLIEEPLRRSTEEEVALLQAAVEAAEREIQSAKQRLSQRLSADSLELFDFYSLMLAGDQLVAAAEARIRAGSSAFSAVRATVDELVAAFELIEDEYLRARGEDVSHVGNKLLAAILGATGPAPGPVENVVLLGDLVSITDMAAFDPEQLAGILCLQGSPLSHTAVLARSLGIPAVVGIGPVDHLVDGSRVVVDGDRGFAIFDPAPATLDDYRARIADEAAYQAELLGNKSLPAVTLDGFKVRLLANTGLLADVRPGLARGAEGIGLYRSEIPFLSSEAFPTEAEQYDIYRELLSIYHPLPVTMRTLDVGGDKQLPYLPFQEDNPSLGWRGIRFSLDNLPVLVTQLRAMLRASAGLDNLRVMCPMVSSLAEVEEVRAVLKSLVAELRDQGLDVGMPPLGIMVEVPGVLPLLPHLKDRVDFLSVGTNDLTQYLLAVDRGNPHVATRYDHLHPAVLHTLADICRLNRKLGFDLSVCGEMAADPVAVVLLVGLEIQNLSMNAYSLPRIKALIRGLTVKRCRRLANAALKLGDAGAIREKISKALRRDGFSALLDR